MSDGSRAGDTTTRKSLRPDVALTTWADHLTVGGLLQRAALMWPDAIAIAMPGQELTFSELLDRSVGAARSLSMLGMEPGDHVGLLLANGVEHVEWLLGAALLGCVAVPLGSRIRAHEIAQIIPFADLRCVVTSEPRSPEPNLLGHLHEAFPELSLSDTTDRLALSGSPRLERVVVLGRAAPGAYVADAPVPSASADGWMESAIGRTGPAATALMLLTSGTSGLPKACVHTHASLVSTAVSTAADIYELDERDRMLVPLPMHHIASILPLCATLATGARFCATGNSEPAVMLDLMLQHQVNWVFFGFPPLAEAVIGHATCSALHTSPVRAVMCTGTPTFRERLSAAFPAAALISSYGSTETGGAVTYHRPWHSTDERRNTNGVSIDGAEVAVVCGDGSIGVAPDSAGEIVVRGPSLFRGYYRDEAATRRAIDAAGWFHTGDLGHFDPSGHLVFAGRLDEAMKVGGENVSPMEVENFLNGHPSIVTAHVVSIPDARLGEVVAAFVEVRDGHALAEADVIEYCRDRIARFKVPRLVRLVDEWPKSATKVDKVALRNGLIDELGRSGELAMREGNR